jgi:proteasome lid subunit RPN8/RPN11
MTSVSPSIEGGVSADFPASAVLVGQGESALPRRTPPSADCCLLHGVAPGNEHPRIVITQQALRQVEQHCSSNTNVELGGLLLGHAYLHGREVYVEIRAALPATTEDQGPVHFTFTGDAWSRLHRDKQRTWPNLEIVGWFHTHPNLGVFFSDDDEVVHAAAFTQPWHVALVVDPVRRHASFFSWAGQLITPVQGFYEVIPPDAEPEERLPRTVVDWAIVLDDSWLYQSHYSPGSRMPLTLTQMPTLPLVSPWAGVVLGALGFVMGLIALILVLMRT